MIILIKNIDGGAKLDLTYFHTFREVAECKSFTKAGEKLGYAQSSITTQIQKIEKEYNVQLFERFGREMRLTPPGEILLKITNQMLELFEASKEKVANQSGGTLSIGAIDSLASYYLPSFLQVIRDKYEEVTIKLQTDQESAIIEKIKNGEIDIALLLDKNSPDPSLNCYAIKEEPLLLIVNSEHPLASLPKIELHHLHGLEWIMSEESCLYRTMLEKVLKDNQINYKIGLELGNPEAVKRCVRNGLGIAILPQMVVEEEIHRKELIALPFQHREIQLRLQLIIHPKKWMSKPLTDFIQFLQDKDKV